MNCPTRKDPAGQADPSNQKLIGPPDGKFFRSTNPKFEKKAVAANVYIPAIYPPCHAMLW